MNETNPTTQAAQAQALQDLAYIEEAIRYPSSIPPVKFDRIRTALAQAVPQPTPSQPSEGESVGAQPAMDWQPRQVRMERTKGSTIAEMRAGLSRDLYNTGDCILCWVNEGDCLMHLPAAPTQEQGQAK